MHQNTQRKIAPKIIDNGPPKSLIPQLAPPINLSPVVTDDFQNISTQELEKIMQSIKRDSRLMSRELKDVTQSKNENIETKFKYDKKLEDVKKKRASCQLDEKVNKHKIMVESEQFKNKLKDAQQKLLI